MTDEARAEAVLAAMRQAPYLHGRPAVIVRVLNFDGPCGWCPVGPPRDGEECASVPEDSRRAVERVLRELVKAGRVEKLYPRTRTMTYVVTD